MHPSKIVHDYMTFRASLEGQKHELDPAWYERHWENNGVRRFFGVVVDDDGLILSDSQNPTALAKWRRERLKIVSGKSTETTTET